MDFIKKLIHQDDEYQVYVDKETDRYYLLDKNFTCLNDDLPMISEIFEKDIPHIIYFYKTHSQEEDILQNKSMQVLPDAEFLGNKTSIHFIDISDLHSGMINKEALDILGSISDIFLRMDYLSKNILPEDEDDEQ